MVRVALITMRCVPVLMLAAPVATFAHFKLVEPASWVTEDMRGDPQKLGPCGGDPKGQNEKLTTGQITRMTGAVIEFSSADWMFCSSRSIA